MKNNLTRAEWLALSDYLQFSDGAFGIWNSKDELSQKYALLQSAEAKVLEVAKELKGGEEE